MLADHVLGTAQADDRLMLAAVLARRGELVALQAEHAAKAPRQVRGAKPGLAAARARRALASSLAMKNPSVWSRSGLTASRFDSPRAGCADNAASTTASFSRFEIVQVE